MNQSKIALAVSITASLIFSAPALAHPSLEDARRLYAMSTLDPSLLPLAINELKKVIALTDNEEERQLASELLRKIQSDNGSTTLPKDPDTSDKDNGANTPPKTLDEYQGALKEHGIDLWPLRRGSEEQTRSKIEQIANNVRESEKEKVLDLLYDYANLLAETGNNSSSTIKKLSFALLLRASLLLMIEIDPTAKNYMPHFNLAQLRYYMKTGDLNAVIADLRIAFENTLIPSLPEGEQISAKAELNVFGAMVLIESGQESLIQFARKVLTQLLRVDTELFTLSTEDEVREAKLQAAEMLRELDEAFGSQF